MVNPSIQELLDLANKAERISRDYGQARELYESVLVQTTPSPDKPTFPFRLKAREKLGDLLYRLGKQEEALKQFEAYRAEAQTPAEKTNALSLLGHLLSSTGNQQEAIPLLQEALLLSAELDTATQALAYLGMGSALFESGRLVDALDNFDRALPGFIESGNKEQQLRVYNWQGMVYARLGLTDRSIKAFQDGLELARGVGARASSILLNNLGEAYQNLFDMNQALIYHQEGMQLAESTRLASNMANLARNMGLDLLHLGRSEEGLAYLYRALSLSDESGRTAVKLQTLYALSLAEIQMGNLEMARTHAKVLLELSREKSARIHEAEGLYALGMAAKLRGEMVEAGQHLQQASFLAHETEQRMLLWQIHVAIAEIATTPNLADVHYGIAADVIRQTANLIGDKKLREKFLAAPQIKAILEANAG